MTVLKAAATLALFVILLAVLGAFAGCVVGVLVPEHYRIIVRGGRDPGFDPVSFGMGQGLTQGAAAGVAVGLAAVALLTWREIRTRAGAGDMRASQDGKTPAGPRHVLVTAVSILLLGVFLALGLGVGLLWGEMSGYHRHFLGQRDLLARELGADPAFAGVRIHEESTGNAVLEGEVADDGAKARLRESAARALGETRAGEALRGVVVGRPSSAGTDRKNTVALGKPAGRAKGVAEASAAVAGGLFKLKEYPPLPYPPGHQEYVALLRERCGVLYEVPKPPPGVQEAAFIEETRGWNEVMMAAIRDKHGQGIFEELRVEGEKRWRAGFGKRK